MNIKLYFKIIVWGKIKYRKFKKWENYLQFAKNPDNYSGCAPLSIGTMDGLPFAKYEDLFQELPEYKILVSKYAIPGISDKQSEYKKAFAIMDWLTQHTDYSGGQMKVLPDDSLKILQFSVDKGFKCAINCRDKAIVLTDLLLAHGIKAYPVLLQDGNRWGSHFIVHVFCRDVNKWVVFDPSFHCCFTDESGMLLNIFELRQLFLANKRPQLIGYSFNRTTECQEIYLQYFIGAELTYITTWKDNSNQNRKTKDISKRKDFSVQLPEVNKAPN